MIEDPIKQLSSKKAKVVITETLENMVSNLNFIISEKISITITKECKSLITKIKDVLKWYSEVYSKVGVLDYCDDFININFKFIELSDKLPKIYTYNLSLEEGRFKFFKEEIE